jgi:hypothetical protein
MFELYVEGCLSRYVALFWLLCVFIFEIIVSKFVCECKNAAADLSRRLLLCIPTGHSLRAESYVLKKQTGHPGTYILNLITYRSWIV